MAPFENTFSWSFSRSRTFTDCAKKYWFHYYGSWGGWDYAADERTREIYRLKNLTGLHLMAGDVVHRAIERALTAFARGTDPDPEAVLAWCKAEMQKGLIESRDDLGRNAPKKFARLAEHEYGPAPSREFLEKIAAKIGTSVRNFFTSRSFSIIREIHPDDWLAMETLDSFNFEGTKVYAVPDFAAKHEGETLIFDWKTGRPDARNKDQVVLYALFAAAKWGVDPDHVQGAPVYLLEGGDFQPLPAAAPDRERVATYMRTSIETMKKCLANPDKNEAKEPDFAPKPGNACRWCNFRSVCPDAV